MNIEDRARAYLGKMEKAIAGKGGHNATFAAACTLTQGFGFEQEAAFKLLSEWNATHCSPPWSESELMHKVEDSLVAPTTKPRGYLAESLGLAVSRHRHTSKWPSIDEHALSELRGSGWTLETLEELSPLPSEDLDAIDFVRALLPGNPFICVAVENTDASTRRIEILGESLNSQQLIVPNPMTGFRGKTKSGRPAIRSLENTGDRTYLVIECDFEEDHLEGMSPQDLGAAVLIQLSHYAPLAMAVHSGNESIHGWFRCSGEDEGHLRRFMNYAVSLGADRMTWTKCQFVRMPNGLRRPEEIRQTVHFWNPDGQVVDGANLGIDWAATWRRDLPAIEQDQTEHLVALLGASEKPLVHIPIGDIQIRDTALAIGHVFSSLTDLFTRGNSICEIFNGEIHLLSHDAIRTRFEKYLSFAKRSTSKNDEVVILPTKLSSDDAKSIFKSRELAEALPPISLVSNSPIAFEQEGHEFAILDQPYNQEAGGVFVRNPIPIDQEMPISQAVEILTGILEGFDFVSKGDRARAFAAIIVPALKLGGLITAPTPIAVIESDESQAGKTYFSKLQRAVYREKPVSVSKKSGGVGSFDESLQSALFSGAPFIAFDNIRGVVDSQILESAITAGDDPISVRIPYHGEKHIDVSRVNYQMTSNAAEMTQDLANRSSIIRIKKRPHSFKFRDWNGRELVPEVIANQTTYLSAVFSLVRKWVSQGKPKKDVREFHDFREWAGILQWFVSAANMGDLLADHHSIQQRAANTELSWLRSLAVKIVENEYPDTIDSNLPNVKRSNLCDEDWTASDLGLFSESCSLEIPKFRGGDEAQRNQAIGRVLAKIFKDGAEICIDGITVTRTTKEVYFEKEKRNREKKIYRFNRH